MRNAPGFFDFDHRLRLLSDLGDQLEAYRRLVDFEAFRPELDKALVYLSGPPAENSGRQIVLGRRHQTLLVTERLARARSSGLTAKARTYLNEIRIGGTDWAT